MKRSGLGLGARKGSQDVPPQAHGCVAADLDLFTDQKQGQKRAQISANLNLPKCYRANLIMEAQAG